MPTPRSARRLLATGLASAAAVAAPGMASAVSLVYTDQNNVWSATPDGSVKRQVTTDGVEGAKWVAASQADTGRILAFRSAGSASSMTYMNPDGSIITSGLTPVKDPSAAMCSLAGSPLHSRMNASGTLAVYDFLCTRFSYGLGGGMTTTMYTVLSSTQRVSDIGSVFLPDAWLPTFVAGSTGPGEVGERILAPDPTSTNFLEQYSFPAGQVPKATAVIYADVPSGSVYAAEASRDGSRVVVDERVNGASSSSLYVYGRSAPLGTPGADFTSGCRVPTAAEANFPSWSPDGSMLAWTDVEGVKVATITSIAGSVASPPPCGVGSVTLLSATGVNPTFSNAAPPIAGGAATGTSGGGATVAALAVTAPGSASRRAIRSKGLTVSTRCAAACTVRATMKAGSRVVARGTTRLKRAGVARIRLRGSVPRKVKSVTITITTGSATGTKVVRVTG